MTTNTKVTEVNFSKVFGGVPREFLYEDEQCVAFDELEAPQAPVHFLVVPRRVLPRLSDATDHDEKILGHLLTVARRVASTKGLDRTGYRVVMIEGPHGRGGQPVLCPRAGGAADGVAVWIRSPAGGGAYPGPAARAAPRRVPRTPDRRGPGPSSDCLSLIILLAPGHLLVVAHTLALQRGLPRGGYHALVEEDWRAARLDALHVFGRALHHMLWPTGPGAKL